ncbi:DUF3131 domain-containing protein [Novosphingobium profundi]|uniref:DUF3131 domain-containing protein n=1 Tax=Novosphingobium profundi TaxID=1774954 RepID=UPI001BD99942|nr:DUF3131 domain-containing protein [Novosphingobium profundi]MBT0668009.1 DUF3131 domain-containing protein [Novosphingobium profundi]
MSPSRVLLRLLAIFLTLGTIAPAQAETASDPVVAGTFSLTPKSAAQAHPGRSGPLSEDELAMARTAWRYFQNNTQGATGLVNAVDAFPSTTLWDIGSSIAAIVSANQLGVIGPDEAQGRLSAILATLARIELFRQTCPNKAYNTQTAQRVTYTNEPGEIGCSALDVGRLLLWMRILEQRYPDLAPAVGAAVAHWNVPSLVRAGELYGTALDDKGQIQFLQEGRLGYEEYAASAFRLWGYDTAKAAAAAPYGLVSLYGVKLPYDARDPKLFGAHNYVVTESYALDGIEMGWDLPGDATSGPFTFTNGWIARSAQRVYQAQEERYARTGIFTARTEHQLAGAPYFVYDTVFSDGVPWATITDTGESYPQYASVSLKGALGLWALWDTPYTDALFAHVRSAFDPEKGFYEGLLESNGERIPAFTANNNGIILETLLYKAQGPILKGEALGTPRTGATASASAAPQPAPAAAPTPPPVPFAATPGGPTLPPAEDSPIVEGARWVAPRDAAARHPGRNGPLSERETALAAAAWSYIKRNTQGATGLVNAAENYPSSTLWDTAAVIGGIVAADQLGLAEHAEAQGRLSAILASLRKIPLFQNLCPNKAFNTATLQRTDYSNSPKEIGCSALDMGRALVWMKIVEGRYPELAPAVQDLVRYWKIAGLVRGGELYGTAFSKGKVVYLQEGRLGYEEYSAKGFALWGQEAKKAAAPEPYATAQVQGVTIAHDQRTVKSHGASNHVVTESAMLDGIEFGWDAANDNRSNAFEFTDGWRAAQAWHIYLAQERRAQQTGILTARTEHQLATSPYFAYDTVYADGTPWATIDARGQPITGASAVALKAAIGMWVLWPTPYTDKLFDAVAGEFDPERGIYEGVLEGGGRINSLSANNNGIILEALAYKVGGPLVRKQ